MLKPTDESRLLSAVAAGDRGAAEELVRLTYAQVFAALMRMTQGDRDLAADLTQETYRKAWKALSRFDRRSRWTTWLYRIAYTTFLNDRRKLRESQGSSEQAEEKLPDTAPDQEQQMDRRQVARRLRHAVMGLPEELRFTVTARFWAELSVEEIAKAENVTGAAIRKRLKNAKARLHQVLKTQEDAA